MADEYEPQGDDMYSDAPTPPEEETAEPAPEPEPEAEPQAEDTGGQTVVPKSVFGSYECKPGERKTFEVVGDHDDEVELKFVGKESGEEAAEEPPVGPMSEMME